MSKFLIMPTPVIKSQNLAFFMNIYHYHIFNNLLCLIFMILAVLTLCCRYNISLVDVKYNCFLFI